MVLNENTMKNLAVEHHQINERIRSLNFPTNFCLCQMRILVFTMILFCFPFIMIYPQYLKPQLTATRSGNYQKGISEDKDFSTVFTFDNSDRGSAPVDFDIYGNMIYGVAMTGGYPFPYGLIYKMKTDGTGFETWEFDFNYPYPYPWSIVISDNVIYGTSTAGGAYKKGVLFRINTDFTGFQVLYDFNFSFKYPRYYIIISGDMIYGNATDFETGSNSVTFKIKTDGAGYTALKIHEGSISSGKPLLFNNYLYGLTFDQGTTEPAKLYKIKTDGTGYVKLHDFNSNENGKFPFCSLNIIGTTLYGTTRRGGINNSGMLFKINTDGTGFKNLYSFTKENGWDVTSTMVQNGSSFYGATDLGGINDLGTLFRVNTDGSGYSKIFDFADSLNGYETAELIFRNDTLFGITTEGGEADAGTVFTYRLEDLNDTVSYQPPIINLMTGKTSFVSTRKGLQANNGSLVDLDTTFTVTGSTAYTHTWNKKEGGNLIAINEIVSLSKDTTFYLIVNNDLGCSYKDSVTIQVKGTTKINDTYSEKGVQVYPNPNDGSFQIRISSGYLNTCYEIFDIKGALLDNGNIDCQAGECIFHIILNVPSGVYSLIIRNDNALLYQGKVIISK